MFLKKKMKSQIWKIHNYKKISLIDFDRLTITRMIQRYLK